MLGCELAPSCKQHVTVLVQLHVQCYKQPVYECMLVADALPIVVQTHVAVTAHKGSVSTSDIAWVSITLTHSLTHCSYASLSTITVHPSLTQAATALINFIPNNQEHCSSVEKFPGNQAWWYLLLLS